MYVNVTEKHGNCYFGRARSSVFASRHWWFVSCSPGDAAAELSIKPAVPTYSRTYYYKRTSSHRLVPSRPNTRIYYITALVATLSLQHGRRKTVELIIITIILLQKNVFSGSGNVIRYVFLFSLLRAPTTFRLYSSGPVFSCASYFATDAIPTGFLNAAPENKNCTDNGEHKRKTISSSGTLAGHV